MEKSIVIIGSSSIHTIRYINGISPYFNQIVFITNKQLDNKHSQLFHDNILVYPCNFKLSSLTTKYKIAKILKKHNANIVHIHQANSYAYHALKGIKAAHIDCKIILTTWGSDILLLPQKNIILKSMVKYNLKHAHCITAGSLYMSNKIKQLSPQAQNIHTINFGVQDFPHTIDLSQKENIILSNRLHKSLYNIDKIIIAFAQLIKKEQFSNFQLVIAANGDDSEKLNKLVGDLNIKDSVKFIGMVDYISLQSWYKRAKLFISVPSSDSASLSSLEAMSFGCYPILSNLPANIEYIIDGVNGTICQNISKLSHDMATALHLISSTHEYEKIAQFNYELVGKKAVFTENIKKFVELYGLCTT